jgi:hypothetical protein
VKSKQLKLVSAGIGASAVVAMSALGVAFSEVSAAQPEPPPPGPVTPSEVTMGETTTTTIPPTEVETSIATPPVTATTPEGFATP